MKSLQLTAQGKLHYTSEANPPTSRENETILSVKYCGICRTDAKMWKEGQRDLRMPRVLGHEFCGTDSDGSLFVVWPGKSCKTCNMCSSGYENLCPDIEIIGFHRDGGMAELVSVPTDSLIELPSPSSAKYAIFAEPAACAINALEQLGINTSAESCDIRKTATNKRLLIIGGGTCGLLIALCAKEFGLDVTIIEKSVEKRNKSAAFRKETGISVTDKQPDEGLFDYCVNASSSIESFTDGIQFLKPVGKYCIFSGLYKKDNISAALLNRVHYHQLTICGSYGCTKSQMQNAVKIIYNKTSAVGSLIEGVISLHEAESKMPAVIAGQVFRYIISYV